jgi:hypothetical protein
MQRARRNLSLMRRMRIDSSCVTMGLRRGVRLRDVLWRCTPKYTWYVLKLFAVHVHVRDDDVTHDLFYV